MMATIQTVPGLTQQVYKMVLDEICDGVLAPGAHLVQEQIAQRFGVSRQPVQQAMALLKADGLVEELGKRGLYVTSLDLTLMRDHYDIRATLDGLAARLAALKMPQDKSLASRARQEGEAILKRGKAAIAQGKVREQIRHDEAFHTLIYELSGNPLLAPTTEFHWRFLRRVMGDVLRHAAPPRTIWQQHARILKAIVSGDAIQAEQLAIEHIHQATESLTTVFGDITTNDDVVAGVTAKKSRQRP